MAMTAGLGNFGSMSISSQAKDLRIELMEKLCQSSYTIVEVSNLAQLYFQDEYWKSHAIPVPHQPFEFWIGGYGNDNKHGENWKIELRDGQWLDPAQLVEPEISSRIIWGRTDPGNLSASAWL